MNGTDIINQRVERDESALRKALDQLAIGHWEALDQMMQWNPDLLSSTEVDILNRLTELKLVQEYRDR